MGIVFLPETLSESDFSPDEDIETDPTESHDTVQTSEGSDDSGNLNLSPTSPEINKLHYATIKRWKIKHTLQSQTCPALSRAFPSNKSFVKKLHKRMKVKAAKKNITELRALYTDPFVPSIIQKTTVPLTVQSANVRKHEKYPQKKYNDDNATPRTPIKLIDLPEVPSNQREAYTSPYAEYWKRAERAEINSHQSLQTWLLTNQIDNYAKPLNAKWVYAYKEDWNTGLLIRFKARLVAAGHTQRPGIDYTETFSPVVKIQSVRLMIALALMMGLDIEQLDIQTAYLHGTLKERQFMRMPQGYTQHDENRKPLMCLLIHSLYGLHQAGRELFNTLSDYLAEQGFEPCKADPCTFKRREENGGGKYVKFSKLDNNGQRIFLLVYVDDLLIISDDKKLLAEVKKFLKERFGIRDQGSLQTILGIQYIKFPNSIYVGQPAYTKTMLEELNFWNCVENGKTVLIATQPTPMAVG